MTRLLTTVGRWLDCHTGPFFGGLGSFVFATALLACLTGQGLISRIFQVACVSAVAVALVTATWWAERSRPGLDVRPGGETAEAVES